MWRDSPSHRAEREWHGVRNSRSHKARPERLSPEKVRPARCARSFEWKRSPFALFASFAFSNNSNSAVAWVQTEQRTIRGIRGNRASNRSKPAARDNRTLDS